MKPRTFSSPQDAIDEFARLQDQDWPGIILLDEDSLVGVTLEHSLDRLRDRIQASGKNCKLMIRSSSRFQSQVQVDAIIRRPTTPRRMIMKLDRVLLKPASQPTVLPAQSSGVADEEANQNASDGCSVLVVEDHPINRKLAVILLGKLNCRIVTANHGGEALECMERESFDVVLLDLHMPVMDGFETARRIRQKYDDADQPLLVPLTAAASLQDRELAKSCGMTDFLMKPIQFE